TFITNVIVAFWPTSSSTSDSIEVAKPVSSACSLYLPACNPTSRYSPRALVTSVNCRPIARSVAVIVTPGRIALDSSVAVPTIVASTCAHAGAAVARKTRRVSRRLRTVRIDPSVQWPMTITWEMCLRTSPRAAAHDNQRDADDDRETEASEPRLRGRRSPRRRAAQDLVVLGVRLLDARPQEE